MFDLEKDQGRVLDWFIVIKREESYFEELSNCANCLGAQIWGVNEIIACHVIEV